MCVCVCVYTYLYIPASGPVPQRASQYRQGTSGVRCFSSIHPFIYLYCI